MPTTLEELKEAERRAKATLDRVRACYQLLGDFAAILARAARELDLGGVPLDPAGKVEPDLRLVEGRARVRYEQAKAARERAERDARVH